MVWTYLRRVYFGELVMAEVSESGGIVGFHESPAAKY
jgi:hypothetical protein